VSAIRRDAPIVSNYALSCLNRNFSTESFATMSDERRSISLDFETPLRGQRVFVTGHTGFTGGWLVTWLNMLGCEVAGLALPPVTVPNLFDAAQVGDGTESIIGDIRDFTAVRAAIDRHKPAVIFHLAAQPLVSRSFADPVETFTTNAIGTVNVLEASRLSPGVRAVVCITTDKVYQDQDWAWGYREIDPLGGKDPYSASKACAELIAGSYRATLAARGNGVLIANARGGNIIGGGDWSLDRIVPDFVRAVEAKAAISLRNPDAVRPWQHVMALTHGYLVLAGRLLAGDATAADNWNFGPTHDDAKSVRMLVERLSAEWARPDIAYAEGAFPETRFLHLDSTRAREVLRWRPPLNFDQTVRLTAEWYRGFSNQPAQAKRLTVDQIHHYREGIAADARS
jgi:CDP-glucose 4,6-dehydratase